MRIDLAGFGREAEPPPHEVIVDIVRRADALGYDGVWFNEFHFRPAQRYPSLLLLGADLLARTERIRFGTSVLVLPVYHPLLLAEQIAQVDWQSGGRLDVGLGRGTDAATFAALGIAADEAGTRFDESFGIIRAALTEGAVAAAGPTWRFERVAVRPPTPQRPHPPFYMAATSPESIASATANGMPLLLSLEPNEQRQLPPLEASLAGRPDAADLLARASLSRYVLIAPTRPEADALVARTLALLNARRSASATERGQPNPAPRDAAELLASYAVAGAPDDCYAQLAALFARTGTRAIRCFFSANGVLDIPTALAGMELFAREVMSALRQIA